LVPALVPKAPEKESCSSPFVFPEKSILIPLEKQKVVRMCGDGVLR